MFVCLPTGEGKSLCYSTLSLVFDHLRDCLDLRYDCDKVYYNSGEPFIIANERPCRWLILEEVCVS